jgi:transcriptional regulator with XRE-family HTH domain
MDEIGNKIKKVRELRNYSRQYMATQLNIAINSYGKIERNEANLSFKRLVDIAKILNVSVTYLIKFDENKILNAK